MPPPSVSPAMPVGGAVPIVVARPSAVVAALCSRDLAKAERFAAAYDGCRAFGDYGQMLAEGDLDAVFVLTPPALHAAMSIAAVEAGLATCCEKPLALTRAEAAAMLAAGK